MNVSVGMPSNAAVPVDSLSYCTVFSESIISLHHALAGLRNRLSKAYYFRWQGNSPQEFSSKPALRRLP